MNDSTSIIKVEAIGEIFRCHTCDNEVIVTKVGTGTLFCCGKPMEKIGTEDDFKVETEEGEEDEE